MWFFDCPEIIYGADALSHLEELKGERAFIVTDPVLHSLGYTDRIAARLAEAGIAVASFTEVEPEPSLQTVRRGAEQMRAFQPDWIVGLGGGSAMDAAKAMWVLYERPDLQPDEISPMMDLNIGKLARLIAIPTTAGTGSEVTWATVLTDLSDGRKLSLGSRKTLPTLAIVDPALTAQLPPARDRGHRPRRPHPRGGGLCGHLPQRLHRRALPQGHATGLHLSAARLCRWQR